MGTKTEMQKTASSTSSFSLQVPIAGSNKCFKPVHTDRAEVPALGVSYLNMQVSQKYELVFMRAIGALSREKH